MTMILVAFSIIVVLIAALTLFGTVGGWLARRRNADSAVIPSPDVDFAADRESAEP